MLQNGNPFDGDDGPHENGGAPATATLISNAGTRRSTETCAAMTGFLRWYVEEGVVWWRIDALSSI